MPKHGTSPPFDFYFFKGGGVIAQVFRTEKRLFSEYLRLSKKCVYKFFLYYYLTLELLIFYKLQGYY